MLLPRPFRTLIDTLATLPGVGPRMAERIALYLFRNGKQSAHELARALTELHAVTTCTNCFALADAPLCAICANPHRDQTTVCVVEDALAIVPLEQANTYTGLYHVLNTNGESRTSRRLSKPNADVSPTVSALHIRCQRDAVREVILATNPTTEGDYIALTIRKALSDLPVTITRLGRGLTTGGDIEYVDPSTLRAAFQRRETLSPEEQM